MVGKRVLVWALVLSWGVILLSGCQRSPSSTQNLTAQGLTEKQLLGKFLFFDRDLSTPHGQACADCHSPSAGFADPASNLPVSGGVLPNRFGNRNAPSAAYAAFSPTFHFDKKTKQYVGGQFWDGRAATLVDQVQGPLLNPLEMHNPDKATVVNSVRQSGYAGFFKQVFGQSSLNNTSSAFHDIEEAIAAFEGSSEVCQFTSKYDYSLEGKVKLTDMEKRGLALFEGKGKCASCHPSRPGPYSSHPLFTNFAYYNIGIPKNWSNPFLSLPPSLNPAGRNYIDLGLGNNVAEGGTIKSKAQYGKFLVPTLRNIAKTAPYGHNGYFKTLTEVVQFHNTRDIPGKWPAPEVPQNINKTVGNLGLTNQEVDDIVAFLGTLTDGYTEGYKSP